MSNSQLEERQEQERVALLAGQLGISLQELLALEYEITENASDDGLLYSYIIEFAADFPRIILDKIPGISGNVVEVGPGTFDR